MPEDVNSICTGIIGLIIGQTTLKLSKILTNARSKLLTNAQPILKIHQASFPASSSSLFTIHETPQLLTISTNFLKDENWDFT